MQLSLEMARMYCHKLYREVNKMLKYQQGDVLLDEVDEVEGEKLNHLVLMDGELTGHKHRVIEGEAELYEKNGVLYLNAKTSCTIGHEEHHHQTIVPGKYRVRRVVEQDPFSDAIRQVQD